MDKRMRIAAVAAMLACVSALGATTALAEHPTGPICMDILWNADLLEAFPRAPAMCQEIAVRDGKKFARFTAKVTDVAPEAVKVRFLTSSGSEEREITLKPGPNARVQLGGKKVEYAKLQKGDVLTFWVPERQLGVISNPDDTASSTIVLK
jgi:hypothetical protein